MILSTRKSIIKKVIFVFSSASLMVLSLLCGYKLWHNVLATPWTPITPPSTGPQTPPGYIFSAPSPQIVAGTYHSSLIVGLDLDPNTFRAFYTLDGSDPDGLSTEYLGSINIPFSEGALVRLRTVAYDGTGLASSVNEVSYLFDNTTPVSIGSSNLSDLINMGVFSTLSDGSTAPPATVVNVETVITIPSSLESNSSVLLPKDLQIVRTDGTLFNPSELSAAETDNSLVSGLGNGVILENALQWGIIDHSLTFSTPITINLYVGTNLNGQTLNISRSINSTSGWTNDGIVSPYTCVVTAGICQFQTIKASYFVATSIATNSTPTPTQTPSNNGSNGQSSNNSSNNSTPQCNDKIPETAPDLFKIITTKGSSKIVFTPVTGKTTGYAVIYGFKKGDERYAATFDTSNNNQGEQNFTINKLNPKSTYYFSVTAINGCVSGPWSDWIPAKADRKKEVNKYKTVVKNKVKTLVNQFK